MSSEDTHLIPSTDLAYAAWFLLENGQTPSLASLIGWKFVKISVVCVFNSSSDYVRLITDSL